MNARFASPLVLPLCLLASLAHADDAADTARTLDLYKRFSYTTVAETDASRVFDQQQIKFNPRNKMQNPDPAWIPGWDQLQMTNATQTAILQAAINRTWTAKIHADYKLYRAGWAALDKQFRPELERVNGLPGYYARASGLAKLLGEVRTAATAKKLMYPAGTAPATVGIVDDIARSMVAVHRDAKLGFLMSAYLVRADVALADFVERGRPFADDATERDLFVAFAMSARSDRAAAATLQGTPALPKMFSEYGGFEAVKWPQAKQRAAEVEKLRAKLVADNATAFDPGPVPKRIPHCVGGAIEADSKLCSLTKSSPNYGPLVITKVGKSEVEATMVWTDRVPYGCKWNGAYDSNLERVMDCKYREVKQDHVLAIGLASLPEGLELQKGDEIAGYVDFTSKKETKKKTTYQTTLRALTSVTRGGQSVATYW